MCVCVCVCWGAVRSQTPPSQTRRPGRRTSSLPPPPSLASVPGLLRPWAPNPWQGEGHPAQVGSRGWRGTWPLAGGHYRCPSIPLTGQFSPVFYRTFQSRKCDLAADLCLYLVFVHKPALRPPALQGCACVSVQAPEFLPRGPHPRLLPGTGADCAQPELASDSGRESRAACFLGRGWSGGTSKSLAEGLPQPQPPTTCSVGSGDRGEKDGESRLDGRAVSLSNASRVWEEGTVTVIVFFTC